MARPETPKMSVATTSSVIWACSSSFSPRLVLRRLRRYEVDPAARGVP
jgi:hypothetical protein